MMLAAGSLDGRSYVLVPAILLSCNAAYHDDILRFCVSRTQRSVENELHTKPAQDGLPQTTVLARISSSTPGRKHLQRVRLSQSSAASTIALTRSLHWYSSLFHPLYLSLFL
uniref:Putative secreted protein n=1 Tax=Anopheles darlingi TaxID=43151 RepID=A0A2M4DJX1_ANODA